MRCDCHVHVVGPFERYPQVPTRTFLAGVAELSVLQRRAAPSGVTRFVIVQPSFYGSDNTLTLETLDALGANGRGVAVIDAAAISDGELKNFHARGVRGLRINLYSPVSAPTVGSLEKGFAARAAIAARMGWHVQVIANIEVLVANATLIRDARVPVVIDHYGLYGGAAPDSRDGKVLLDLLALPHVWVKLSGPYRVSDDPMNTRPDRAWLRAIVAVAPDCCVWGSDWPHTAPHGEARGPDVPTAYRDLSYTQLVDDFIAALPDPALADKILIDNPTRLYQF
jgi:predicted TIM-barrel fold metal-dependent hydrolase